MALSEPEGLVTTAGEPFARGVSAYFDAHPEIRDPLPRIYVEIQPEGMDDSFMALLDLAGTTASFTRTLPADSGIG